MDAAFEQIPIIDISSLSINDESSQKLDKTAKAIHDACKNVGFFYIKNHGIPTEHFESVFAVIKAFFNLTTEEKMKIHMAKSDIFRGYTPLGKELTNNKRDWNEAVDLGLDIASDQANSADIEMLQGPNPWPEYPTEFKELLSQHWDLLNNIGNRIIEGLAISLGLSRDFFRQFTNKSHHMMRVLHYPPLEEATGDNIGGGIGPHIDYGFLTILAQDSIGGLEVKNKAGVWISAPYIPGTLIVNIGHMTQRWTNDYYKATMHQVKSQGNKHRYSFPFFFEPNFDTVVSPLDTYCNKNNPPRYEPLHFGNHIKEKFQTSYADSMNGY